MSAAKGMFNRFDDVFMLDGVRTPMVDYLGAFADANPIDLGIKVAKALFERAGIAPAEVDSVLAGNMTPGGFDQFYVPRHMGLYAGVPVEEPALMAQRICGTGFELFRQAGEVDAFASTSFARAVAAQEAGWFAGEIVAVASWGGAPLARVAAAAVVDVPPEVMGIGPAPAIRLLLARSGLALDDIARFEINEAQGAQTLAVARELGLDFERLNVKGGAIAFGHPLAATGVRLTITVARQLKEIGARWGVASACIGGVQGIALLIESTESESTKSR